MSHQPYNPLASLALLEPNLGQASVEKVALSQAISLKRIADNLASLVELKKLGLDPDETTDIKSF